MTLRTSFLLLAVTIVLLLPGRASAQSQIDPAEVSRILKTLSADDMQGRKVFTPGNEKASQFIQQEFKKIGLMPFAGLTDYQQEFSVYTITPVSQAATINGNNLTAEAIAAGGSTAYENLDWTETSTPQPEKVIIKATDDLSTFVQDFLNKEPQKDYLILVDPAHADRFGRIKRYLERSTTKASKAGYSFVFLLTDQVSIKSYRIAIRNKVLTQKAANVVGVLPGKSKKSEYVIFSGHYDHIGILPAVNGDSIANGADDDASGTTAVIALARYFKKRQNNERTLVFVAFTFEEAGGFGSKYFAKQLQPQQVVAMFNIEMIGKESQFGKNAGFITGFDKSDFGQIIQKNLVGTNYAFHPDPYLKENLFYRSDNATLARLGVPAHTFSTDKIDSDKLYHSVDDEFESLNVANMTNIIKAIAQAAHSIIAGQDTPTRISPEEVK